MLFSLPVLQFLDCSYIVFCSFFQAVVFQSSSQKASKIAGMQWKCLQTRCINYNRFLVLTLFSVVYQELLTRNKSASAEFLEANYDKFFSHYQNLLNSDNYVTRRQALKVPYVVLFVDAVCNGNDLQTQAAYPTHFILYQASVRRVSSSFVS